MIAVAVGNTRTRVGAFDGADLCDPVSVGKGEVGAAVSAVMGLLEARHGAPVVMSSVDREAAAALRGALEERDLARVLRIGVEVPVPLPLALDDASTVGQDRVLCALAAYSRAEQACVVIDAGTAITVDFVDGEGVFQGGVIAPGLAMMLRALHEQTAALPRVDVEQPDPARGPFGKDTRHAMLLGVLSAARGLVREAVERYAETYQAYPQIVATGGDAAMLFEADGLVEHIVPDLQLMGIMESWRRAGEAGDGEA
jgi:type III pantothenate kinase